MSESTIWKRALLWLEGLPVRLAYRIIWIGVVILPVPKYGCEEALND